MGKSTSQIILLVIIGIGLIILGLVAARVIASGGGTGEYSVTPMKINNPAPDLILNDLNDQEVSLANFIGQVILINNWATWCPPCRAEMPILLNYYNEHRDQGFTLIGINAGDPAVEVASFVKENNLTFPILLDPSNKSLITFENENLPNSYVIDQNGNVVLAWTGPISKTMLEKYVTPLLEKR